MKKIILLSACMFLTSTVFATNGSNMIGLGAASRAMGGVGIALSMGPENALKNPSLIGGKSEFEMIFSGTYFSPKVTTQNTMTGMNFDAKESASDTFMIPAIGFTQKITESMTVGLGAYGTSGLGVDFRDTTTADGLSRMSTALSIMKFAPAISYKKDNFGVGASASIVYGALGMSYDRTLTGTDQLTNSVGNIGSEGAGTSDDLALGFDIGGFYKWNNLIVAANYQSKVSLEYKHQIADSATDFGASTITTDKLEQPAEIGFGISYIWNNLTATIDYKMVQWEDTAGYGDFGWENQNVIAAGFSYLLDKTTLRVGFNYAKNPLGTSALENSTVQTSAPINVLNSIGFPATVDTHITAGAGHEVSKNFNVDFAVTYSPETTVTADGMYHPGMGAVIYPTEIKHSQMAISLGGHWMY
jgi:long-chain fatty acid transport protein